MNHLTEEQFEDILQGRVEVPDHVDRCLQCRTRLDQKRALSQRVHQAFGSIHASPDLADRIRAGIVAAQPWAHVGTPRRIILPRTRRRIWIGLAVAAAILIVAIPRSLRLNIGPQTTAAQTALVNIHRANLDSLDEIMAGEDSGWHCPCMDGQTDDGMVMPCCKRGLCMCGCRMQDFQGRPVECCVIQMPNASSVSVVMVPKSPETLGMTPAEKTTATGEILWQATCGRCNMAAVRMGQASCCVIGQVPPDDLVVLVNKLEE
jgi:hypothetical protein